MSETKIIQDANDRFQMYDATDEELENVLGNFRTMDEAKLWASKHGYTVTKTVITRWTGVNGFAYWEGYDR